MNSTYKRALLALLLALGVAFAYKTFPKPSAPPPKPQGEKLVGAPLVGMNYTKEGIGVFYVDGRWGGALPRFGGGGKQTCCAAIPAKWRPGIKVKIEWRTDSLWERDENGLFEKILEVPPYPDGIAGGLFVMFLPGGDVRVYSSNYDPGHPKWPDKLDFPYEECLKAKQSGQNLCEGWNKE